MLFAQVAVIVALFTPTAIAVAVAVATASVPSGTGELLNLLGRLAGIQGFAMMLLTGALAARLSGPDRWLGGLIRIWKMHHLLAAGALLMLMVHVLLLAFGAASVSMTEASRLLFPKPSSCSIWIGWVSLFLLMVFSAPSFSFFGQPDHHIWKRTHLLSGPTVLLGILHAIPRTRSFAGALGPTIWLAFASVSLASYMYRVYYAPRRRRQRYSIARVHKLGDGLVELTLRPLNQRLDYRPGQFIFITPRDPGLASGRDEEHPFSIASAPHESVLRIAVRDAGDATHALQSVAPHSEVLVEGPFGCSLDGADKQLWIGGGSAIAPFVAGARAVLFAGKPADIRVIYCTRDEKHAYYLPELQSIAKKVPGMFVSSHLFVREGYITLGYIAACCPDYAERNSHVAGPPEMVRRVRRVLRKNGVPSKKIHSEEFSLP